MDIKLFHNFAIFQIIQFLFFSSFCPHKQDELYVWDISYIFTHKLLGFANSQQVRYAKSTIKVVTEMLLHLLQWNAYLAQEVSNKVNRVFHMIQILIVMCNISLNTAYNFSSRNMENVQCK